MKALLKIQNSQQSCGGITWIHVDAPFGVGRQIRCSCWGRRGCYRTKGMERMHTCDRRDRVECVKLPLVRQLVHLWPLASAYHARSRLFPGLKIRVLYSQNWWRHTGPQLYNIGLTKLMYRTLTGNGSAPTAPPTTIKAHGQNRSCQIALLLSFTNLNLGSTPYSTDGIKWNDFIHQVQIACWI